MKITALLLSSTLLLSLSTAQEPTTKAPAAAAEAKPTPAAIVAAANTEAPAAIPGELLDAAIAKAKEEEKLLFIKYGWDRCGNCRNLDRLISSSQVKVNEKEFVVIEVHPVQGQDRVKFANYYGIKSGIYPRVVICDSDNKLLAKRTGYGAAAQYNELLTQARQQLAAKAEKPAAPAVAPK